MTKQELAKEIYITSHITGEFKLRSGQISKEYFDKYQFESLPNLLSAIGDQLIALLPMEYDYLAGLEMGGIPIATILSLKTGKPAVFVRKKAKHYGTIKLAEGPEIKGKKLVIIEDVITSGGQVVMSANELRDNFGAEIVCALSVIDREAGGKAAILEAGIELRSLFTMSEIKEIVG